MLNAVELATDKASVTAELEDFEQIVRLHQKRIYRFLLVHTANSEVAEDLTQECFVRAFFNRKKFRGECQVSTWLARIALNLARDYFRNRKLAFWRRTISLEGPTEDAVCLSASAGRHPSPEEHMLQRERLAEVMSAVGQLSLSQREVFVLSVIEEMPLQEIAACMNRRIGTIKSHLFRAMMNVRKGRAKNVAASD